MNGQSVKRQVLVHFEILKFNVSGRDMGMVGQVTVDLPYGFHREAMAAYIDLAGAGKEGDVQTKGNRPGHQSITR